MGIFLRNRTYVTCLSEHDPSENKIGRLSMWRSYSANQVGVGLIIDPEPLYLKLEGDFGAFSSPVYYFNDNDLRNLFSNIANEIAINTEFLRRKGKEEIRGYLYGLIRTVIVCTKHSDFFEEKEWSIIHTDKLDGEGPLNVDVECIDGIPQLVYKIPLQDHAPSGITGISIPVLIERVLIGPTQFPIAVMDAIAFELEKAGVKDAEKRVSFTAIPLRS